MKEGEITMGQVLHINTKPSSLKDIRLAFHMSQGDLAMEAGLSRHAVLRNEQLCYPTPLPGIITALSNISGIGEWVLEERYADDVTLNRIQAGANIFRDYQLQVNCLARSSTYRGQLHPFQVWRECVFRHLELPDSRIYFCSAITVHPATMTAYENFKTGFPQPLEVALTQCGIDLSILGQFKTLGKYNSIHD